MTSDKIIHWYQNRNQNIFIVKYFGSKWDTYKTNEDLYGRWCFITSFPISCITKKAFLEMSLYELNFPKLCFRAIYILFHIQKIKFKNFSVFYFLPFQCYYCISSHVKNFYQFLGGSHLSGDFIFKENNWKNQSRQLQVLIMIFNKKRFL